MSMKKLSSEFDQISNIKENNNPIAEIKKIKAEQFSPNRELKSSPFEAKSNTVPEYYNDHLGKNIEEVYKKRTESYEERQKKLQENRNRELNNNADTGSNISNDVSTPTTEGNMSEGLGEVEVGAEGATTVTSTAVSSSATVVSSASLTGVTVISACAVVAVTVGTGIMNTPPTLENVNYESGTDYLIYEYDINDFQEGQNYKLVVICGNKVVLQKEITEEGHHKELLTGLSPDKAYEFQILGSNGELDDIEYYTFKCYTTKLLEPEAVFMFEPAIDYELGIFDLKYDVYISDYYHSGSDTYLELYSGENLIRTERELDKENFFRGVLNDLPDGFNLNAKVYTTYLDELTLIGEYGYITKYPEDFISNENKLLSTFDFSKESFTNTFNKETGMQELVINTNFDNTKDTNESYRIDLYDVENNLIDSKISSEKEVSFSVPAYYKKVNAVFTPLKDKNNELVKAKQNLVEFDSIRIEYEFNPILFSNEQIRLLENGYYINIEGNREIFSNDNLKVEIIQNNTDGTNKKYDFDMYDGMFSEEIFGMDETAFILDDIKSIEISIYYNEDILIGKYNILNDDTSININSYDIDNSGNININYEAIIPEKTELDNIFASFSGAYGYFELNELKGNIVLNELVSNSIGGQFEITYINNYGMHISKVIETETKDLGLEITTSSYISYTNSELLVNIKFDVEKDGILVNTNLEVQAKTTEFVYNEDKQEYEEKIVDANPVSIDTDSGKYFGFKPITEEGTNGKIYLTYKINSNGFDNEEKTIEITKSIINDYSYDHDKSVDLFNYDSSIKVSGDKRNINYLKTTNSDGTVNYYFDTGFSDNTNNHNERIVYSYTLDSKTVYKYTDFFTGSFYALENVEDLNYDFKLMIFYNYTDGLSYCSDEAASILLNSDNVIDLNNSTIVLEDIDKEIYTEVYFELDATNVDLTNPINITYNGNKHIINIPLNADGEIEFENNDGLIDTDNDLVYSINNDGNILYFNLRFEGHPDMPLNDYLPKVSFSYLPYIINKIGTNNIKNYNSLIDNKEYEIAKYMATYDLESFDISTQEKYENSDGNNIVYFQIPEFESSDRRDSFVVLAYYNDEVIAEGYFNANSYMAEVDTPIIYDEVSYKLVFVKKVNDDYWNPKYQDYTDSIDLGSLTFNTVDVLENINVSLSSNSYTINADLTEEFKSNSNNTFVASVIEYYADGTNSDELTMIEEFGVDTPVEIHNQTDLQIKKVELLIYKKNYENNVIIYKNEFSTVDITLSDYEYDDGNDYISLPFDLDIPEGAVISEASYTYQEVVNEISDTNGNIIIDSLDYNVIYINFNIQFELNGITYNIEKYISHELHGILDYDYEYILYESSSYNYANDRHDEHPYYCDSGSGLLCYYDETKQKYINASTLEETNYVYNGSYFEDGNGDRANGFSVSYSKNVVHVAKISLIDKIGCFNLPYLDSGYTINVTAGGSVVSPDTGIKLTSDNQGWPNVKTEYQIETSTQTFYVTMYHNLVGYEFKDNSVYGINECELSFEIVNDDNILLSDTINYNPPRKSTIASENSFEYNIEGSNSSITKNLDDTINVTIDSGFKASDYPNYAYKLKLYKLTDEVNLTADDTEPDYESDYLTDSTCEINNIENFGYLVRIELYYVTNDNKYVQYDDGSYSYGTYRLGYINTPFVSSAYSRKQGTYFYKYLYLNKSVLNPNYFDTENNSKVTININNTDYEVDLTNSSAQNFGYYSVTVTENDSNIEFLISANPTIGDYATGTITLSSGNDNIGYTDNTYEF